MKQHRPRKTKVRTARQYRNAKKRALEQHSIEMNNALFGKKCVVHVSPNGDMAILKEGDV